MIRNIGAAASALLLTSLAVEPFAVAGPKDARVAPTAVEVAPGEYRPATGSDDPRTRRLGSEMDTTVAEAIQDLGLSLVARESTPPPLPNVGGREQAEADWRFYPRLRTHAAGVTVRLTAYAPGSRVELSREESVSSPELTTLAVRMVVMLRDLFEAGRGTGERHVLHSALAPAEPSLAPPSTGRPVLALNSAVFGGYVGFTIHEASESSDSRLVYPLVALGTGLGLGASLLIADEWNIRTGDAWYLAAGAWWPAASGFLLARSYAAEPADQHLYAVAGATGGLALGALAIALKPASEGGALLAHSGGAFGGLLGAMTQVMVDGSTDGSVERGMGYGAGAGVLLGGFLATRTVTSPSRVLLVDLSASLGGLAGAAVASPLLLVDDTSQGRTRLWVGSAALGTIGGGVIGWYLTAGSDRGSASTTLPFLPYARALPSARGGSTWDLGVTGDW
jgi:hypothetical protein